MGSSAVGLKLAWGLFDLDARGGEDTRNGEVGGMASSSSVATKSVDDADAIVGVLAASNVAVGAASSGSGVGSAMLSSNSSTDKGRAD